MKRVKGYTMAEVAVTAAVIGIIFSIGPQLLTQATRFIRMNTARVETQRDARAALQLINRILRQAKASTVVISNASGQPPYSKISFDKYVTSSTVKSMSFYQEGKSLYVVDTTTSTLSSNIRYIAFTYPRTDDDTIISVSLTVERDTYQGGTKSLQLSVEKVRIMND